ncbi:PTS sugar transporter subunit IIA [Carnobacterium gallinarum]|uniref:PTS sugar transporter subunit IIA n=1 Tax=Carnobacterium gallinarum TaxID=2749 RepID=UPI00055446F2|nr:PTS sugar transporter subunit IIA [Carnobacterium gallinarum]
MIEFILTGHGDFSKGLYQAIEMIAGKQENLHTVLFTLEDTPLSYQNKLKKVLKLNNQPEKVLFFTDLLGGTPFKVCAELAMEQENWSVLSGTNLGMLLEGVALRTFMDNPLLLSKQIQQAGCENITIFSEIPSTVEEVLETGI